MDKAKLIRAISLHNPNRHKAWYEIKAEADDTTEIYLYDEISYFGITARQFVSDLNSVKSKNIKLRINSPGGAVWDGTAIYNAIKEHPAHVETHIEGIAASMASVIALAGDEVHMAENAYYMIHNPQLISMGEASDLRHDADLLDKITSNMVTTYAEASGNTKHQIKQWMNDETWFTAREAKDAGFVDELESEKDATAEFDLSVFSHVPERFKFENRDREPLSIRDTERLLRDAGFSRSQATAILAGGYKAIGRREADDVPVDSVLKLLETIKI
jgi:ATP-dependent Clp endopeptidase proteolytic subunit ClpP